MACLKKERESQPEESEPQPDHSEQGAYRQMGTFNVIYLSETNHFSFSLYHLFPILDYFHVLYKFTDSHFPRLNINILWEAGQQTRCDIKTHGIIRNAAITAKVGCASADSKVDTPIAPLLLSG